MPAPRLTTTAIGGIITTPNPYGVYPDGACRFLRNARPSGPNKLSAMRLPTSDAQGGISGAEIIKLAPLASGKYCAIQMNGTTFAHYGENTTANLYTLPSYVSSTNLYSTEGFVSPVISRSRWLTNTRAGVLCLDTLNPSSGADRTLRSAALPQPQISSVSFVTGQAWPAVDLIATYKALFVRESSDGYLLTSPDSPGYRILNDSLATKDAQVTIKWAYSDDIRAGDYIELYRSNAFTSSDYSVDPGTDCFLVARYVITSSDASAKTVTMTDRQPFGVSPGYETTGQLIYTAGTQEGATQANLQPPVCRAQVVWNNWVLYANVTEDPTFTFDVPAGWGPLSTAYERQYGVGQRAGTGTLTLGSPTVTGVSAANMVGVKAGQYFDQSTGLTGFNATAKVISTTASSFTMSENCVSSGGAWLLQDSVAISGTDYRAGSPGVLALELAASGLFQLTANETLPAEPGVLANGTTLTVRPIRHANSFTVKATNGANYTPILVEYTGTAQTVSQTEQPNMLRYSKYNQPEAVPYANELRIGLGTIIALVPVTDCVFVFCTDGIFMLTGTGGEWRADPFDSQTILSGPQAAAALFDRVHAVTNRGHVEVSQAGTKPLSKGVVEDLIPGAPYQAVRFPVVIADETREEVHILQKSATVTAGATYYCFSALYSKYFQVFVQNPLDRITALCQRRDTATAGEAPYPLRALYVAGQAPTVYRDNSSGAVATVTIALQRVGDPTTLKQWIDCGWILASTAQPSFRVLGMWNGLTSGQSGAVKATRVDYRCTLGVPRAYAMRASVEAGMQVATQNQDFDILGVSLRVAAVTTQQETLS